MELTLPDEVVKSLPSPDGQGIVRVTVSLKMGDGGEAYIVEINDVPVPEDRDEEEGEMPTEDSMPRPEDIASQINRQQS